MVLALVYEVLYLGVFGVDESDLVQALEQIRVGGRRFRNSLSVCSDLDYDRYGLQGSHTVQTPVFRNPTKSGFRPH